jgi:dihydrofolate reductase
MVRKIIVWMGVSLDGFMAGPDGEIDWHHVDDELHAHFNEALRGMGAFLMGRVTYEGMEEVWPTADDDPESTPPMVEFTDIWRDVPKVVYSRTLERVGEGATLVRDVVPEEVRALKAQPGGDMTLGGANLAATFERLGLVDEYRLFVQPVAIGRGRPVFAPDTRLHLDLAETRTYGNGVVMLRYERPPTG